MGKYDYDIGIIGGGAAGLYAASGSAQFGARTLLIEKTDRLGGDCLHFGCVPSKTLIRAAGVWNLAGRSAEFGLPAIAHGKADLAKVMNRVKSVIEKIQPHDSPERFRSLGVDVQFGSAEFQDEHAVKLNGKVFTSDKWVIATGSGLSLPPVEGLDGVPFWTNETVFKQKKLPGRLAVLGGGPIGIELAQAFLRLGSKVTVIEFLDQILNTEDGDMAAVLQKKMETEGMKILAGTKAVRVEKKGTGIGIFTAPAKGEGREMRTDCDALLVATGRSPNVKGLGLDRAGIKYSPRCIGTDSRMRTNVKNIFACGDVNGKYPFTHVAGHEAGIVVANAVLHLPRSIDYGRVPWCTYTDPEIAGIGYNEKRAKEAGIEYRTLKEEFTGNDRALAEGEIEGRIKALLSKKGRIIGCQIIGPHAGDLIHEWITAINGKVKLSTLASMMHAYPTLSEISKKAAGSYYAEKLYSEKTKKLLRLLFGYGKK